MHKTKITARQRNAFWAAFAAATAALGLVGAEKADYRHAVMREEAGCEHLGDLGRTHDFERVMYRLCCDAQDFDRALRYAVCDERRMGFLVKVCCIQLMQLKGADEAEARRYLGGLLDQARVPNGVNTDDDSYWMDLSFRAALKVFQMLDTHRRRLLKAASFKATTFSASVKYHKDGPILVRESVGPDYYATAPFTVNIVKEAVA